MKSIIEEASSVIKAIEKGWIQAGKPQEFSVKVFQEAEKNFLGMTTKSAKIAILFETATAAKAPEPTEKKSFKQKPAPTKPRFEEKAAPATRQAPEAKPVQKERKESPQPAIQEDLVISKKTSRKSEDFWSEAMLAETTQWLQTTLGLLNKSDVQFALDQKRYYLKVNFNKPLAEDSEKEKTIFRSFSYLLMQVLRNKFKRNFRGFKLIFASDLPF
jgi:predicted RNA-binding protein Jag